MPEVGNRDPSKLFPGGNNPTFGSPRPEPAEGEKFAVLLTRDKMNLLSHVFGHLHASLEDEETPCARKDMASAEDFLPRPEAQDNAINSRQRSRSEHASMQMEEPVPSTTIALSSADHGYRAWLFLAGSFMIECLIWGFPFSYGIFLKYYKSSHSIFRNEPGGLSAIGTSAMGIMYLGAPFVGYLLHIFPFWRRRMQTIGLIVMILSLLASSFSTQVWHLVLTQGILFGISGGFVYLPTIQYSKPVNPKS